MHNEPVCIDARMIGVGGTGISSYATSLRAMLPLITARPMLLDAGEKGRSRRPAGRLLAAARPWSRVGRLGGSDGSEARMTAPDIFREAQVHFDLHRRLLAIRPPLASGIMHWTYPVPLRMDGWINIYTVHDAIPLIRSDLTHIDGRRHRRLLDGIFSIADRIITVSDAARTDILAAVGCPPALLTTISPSVPVSPAASIADALPAPLVRGRYLLVCGSIEPRKNIGSILKAYAQSETPLPLVLAGPDGWRAAEFAGLIASTPGVIRLPWQPPATRDALIAHARALLMPSLAEGFGLPIAEAMALGTPVITSATGASAEVAGGAAMLIDPLDIAGFVMAIRRIVQDDALHTRLIDAGRSRAEAFAPARVAPRLAAVYADLVALRDRTAYPPGLD